MIAYFDTSAIVPLLINEPTSAAARRLWTEAERVVSVRLAYPEARAALAQGQRMGRITARDLRATVTNLEKLADQIDIIELTADVARAAGDLAEHQSLRGYDAVHLAAALSIQDAALVVVSADRALSEAAANKHLNVAQL